MRYTPLLLFPAVCQGWVATPMPTPYKPMRHVFRPLLSELGPGEMDNNGWLAEVEDDSPCWQDVYDDDCAMSHAYAAKFVASEWIKSMPCAEGVEDCNMPEDLKLPGAHHKAGIHHVDVMGFLGLKKASPVDKAKEETTTEDGAGGQ